MISIDPGPTESGIARLKDGVPTWGAKLLNAEILAILTEPNPGEMLAVEQIKSYGMPVGDSTFETCVWIGRFIQAFGQGRWTLVPRKTVCTHICGSPRAKDTNIRQALIDRFGAPGTKKSPGTLYGYTNDVLSAVAVGLTARELPGTIWN